MSNKKKNNVFTGIVYTMARRALKQSANSRCFLAYHQPFQPKEVKKFK